MRVGWTPYWLANSLTVGAPLRAARATCALKLAVCCFRLPAIASPFLGHLSSLIGGPVFGVHYRPLRRRLALRLGRRQRNNARSERCEMRAILHAARSETSSNSWKLRVMREASFS